MGLGYPYRSEQSWRKVAEENEAGTLRGSSKRRLETTGDGESELWWVPMAA